MNTHKSIIVIESLFNERRTGKELYEDVISKFKLYHKDFVTSYNSVGNKKEFIQILRGIALLVNKKKYLPIIHIEAHGLANNKSGIELRPSGDYLEWNEVEELFREINIKLKNSLVITLGVCYGSKFTLTLNPSKPAPFFEVITPINEVYGNEIIQGYSDFYQTLLFSNDIIKSVISIKKNNKFKFYGSAYLYEFYLDEVKYLFNEKNFNRYKDRAEMIGLKNEARHVSFETYKDHLREITKTDISRFFMMDIYPENEQRFIEIIKKMVTVHL
jgi:hypothetical protein